MLGIKALGKYRLLVFRALCGCGWKVTVHQFNPGRRLVWGLNPRYLTCPLFLAAIRKRSSKPRNPFAKPGR